MTQDIESSTIKQQDRRGNGDVELAILEAARDLLAERGIAGLSMRQVADRVGVSATAIYHYFDGKQALVNCVVLKAFERFGASLKEAMRSEPKGSVERVYALGQAYLRFAFENQAYFRILFSIQPCHRAGLEELPEGGGYDLLREAVAEAISAGSIRSVYGPGSEGVGKEAVHNANADLISLFLWCTVHGLVTLTMCGVSGRCDWNGSPSAESLLKAFKPLVSCGIREPADGVGTEHRTEERESP